MDCLITLWFFDERWFFGVLPRQSTILFPTIFNILYLLYQRFNPHIDLQNVGNKTVQLLLLILIVAQFINYGSLISKKKDVVKKLENVSQNKHNLIDFLYRLKVKKMIWGQWGSTICMTSLVATIMSLTVWFQKADVGHTIAKIWILMNSLSLLYMIGLFLMFVLRKCSYLLIAWKVPKSYLKFKRVIK